MKFIITYNVGDIIRHNTIEADSLEEVEEKSNKTHPTWTNIIMEDKTQGIEHVENMP